MARTDSRTPKTRLISLSYRSIALGIFWLWDLWNQAAWPKYGLKISVRQAFAFWVQHVRADEPLAGDLECEPLKLEIFILTDGGNLLFWVVLVDQVLDDRKRPPVSRVPGERALDAGVKPILTRLQSRRSCDQ